jgi:antitoxin component YwqK of YwqJK toxin-antitoxin module
MSKFSNFNSPEYRVLKEVFEKIPMMDTYIANIIEEYIYSTVRKYYTDGSLEFEYRTKFGEKDGEYKEWFGSGNLYIQTTYVDGKRHGEYKRWYVNGQLMEQITYVDGKRQGNYKTWDNEGNLMEWINPIEV